MSPKQRWRNAKNRRDKAKLKKYLYVISDGPDYFKIGVSNDPQNRLSTLQTGNPRQLRIETVIENKPDLEKKLHYTFKHRLVQGEWFYRGSEKNGQHTDTVQLHAA